MSSGAVFFILSLCVNLIILFLCDNALHKKLVSMIRKYHNYILHPNPRHREEEPQNIYSYNTSVRQ